jgi:DNA helicase-2/ATP-dependent DNA helicase PcrA
MKERIKAAVGDIADKMTVGTYHSVCHRLLRKYATYIDFNKNFTILSQDDCTKKLKKIAKEIGVEHENLGAYISQKKDKVILPSQALASSSGSELVLANGYEKYQRELKREMAMDFDDLILNTIILLENNPEIKQRINNQWRYITADEAHDSSPRDLKLIQLLAGDSENVCFILDDHQSIYGFRGADIEAVMNVRNIYHNMKIFNLSRNYRCSQTIVEASKSLIAKNTPLIDKKIRAARDYAGSPIIISRTKTPQQEALKVVQYIQALRRKGLKYSDICIEYRMSAASRVLEEALNKAKIKCKIVGGTPFFARAEIQDVLAYLRLIVNEHDFTAFKRAIGVPKRGVGEKTIEKIDEFAREYPGGPIPIRSAIEEIELKGKAGNSIKEFVKFLDDLEVDMAQLAPKDLITKLCTKLQIVDYLQTAYKDNWQERLENIQELVNVASEYADVQELLSQAALYSIEENDEKVDAVNMMTMHSSKGLEFPAVIIVGCNEGTSPHYKSLGNPKQLEEERRLFYVAMTRAKDYLFMTFSDCVLVQGQLQYSKPSRFINEIDKKYIYRN